MRGDGRPVTVHVSHPVPHGDGWVVELRTPGGAARIRDAHAGELVHLPRGVTAVLIAAHPDPSRRSGSRLWLARIPVEGGVPGWLARVGPHQLRPPAQPPAAGGLPDRVRPRPGQRRDAQRGTAVLPPRARRPLRRGVGVAEVTLHTGVSSTEADEPPLAEWFRVPPDTASR